jgi:hypothetical protein
MPNLWVSDEEMTLLIGYIEAQSAARDKQAGDSNTVSPHKAETGQTQRNP